jgi:hypothetical protein
MLEDGVIEPVEESECIGPMVVWENKQGGIKIYVHLRKLNDAFLHDPFPTPFTDYHHIRIAPKDKHKTKFDTEWGSF